MDNKLITHHHQINTRETYIHDVQSNVTAIYKEAHKKVGGIKTTNKFIFK